MTTWTFAVNGLPVEVEAPGMRRLLEALRQVEEEAPGLLEEAAFAATELSRTRGNGGHVQ